MDWIAVAAVASLVVTVSSAAYHFGFVSAKLKEHGDEIKRLRDRLDKFMDYWKTK